MAGVAWPKQARNAGIQSNGWRVLNGPGRLRRRRPGTAGGFWFPGRGSACASSAGTIQQQRLARRHPRGSSPADLRRPQRGSRLSRARAASAAARRSARAKRGGANAVSAVPGVQARPLAPAKRGPSHRWRQCWPRSTAQVVHQSRPPQAGPGPQPPSPRNRAGNALPRSSFQGPAEHKLQLIWGVTAAPALAGSMCSFTLELTWGVTAAPALARRMCSFTLELTWGVTAALALARRIDPLTV